MAVFQSLENAHFGADFYAVFRYTLLHQKQLELAGAGWVPMRGQAQEQLLAVKQKHFASPLLQLLSLEQLLALRLEFLWHDKLHHA